MIQEAPDRLCAAHRHEGNALGVEIPTAALGKRFDRDQIARPLDEDGSTGC